MRSRPKTWPTIRTIIENRINQYGVAEPVVQTQGSDRVVVEIPGVTDVEAVRKLIGSTGLLHFVPIPKGTQGIGQGTHLGTDLPACPDNLQAITTPCVLFNGDQLASAAAGVDATTAQRVVNFTLKGDAATLFDKFAQVAFAGNNSPSNQHSPSSSTATSSPRRQSTPSVPAARVRSAAPSRPRTSPTS